MGQLRQLGHWDIHFVIPKKQLQGVWFPGDQSLARNVTERLRLGHLRHLGQGPQVMIRFTTDHMVARDMITMDRLLSVYQGDANVVADENPARRHLLQSPLECASIPS